MAKALSQNFSKNLSREVQQQQRKEIEPKQLLIRLVLAT